MISVLRFVADLHTAVACYLNTLATLLEPSEFSVTITPPREEAS